MQDITTDGFLVAHRLRVVQCVEALQPYSENGSLWAWKRLCVRASVEDAHFHDIRAKSLTDANRTAGRDYAQALAGHADGSMTEVYVRARDTQTVKPLGGVVERKRVVEKATSKKWPKLLIDWSGR
ncbi:tyrosine-type recombinase/integrase [Acidithiobacillus sp.]|uniref:tyrosine-type recombinase/integrase n=1 Tax=Acidithiobacillus sp. TaxID=1872118 RepID=UPI0025BCE411|nr:tyrosine-type recombinase/integrase [Acidithiobacillus sp.]